MHERNRLFEFQLFKQLSIRSSTQQSSQKPSSYLLLPQAKMSSDYLFQPHHADVSQSIDDLSPLDSGSSENHRPYVPKYSTKDENLLRRVDLTSMESINAIFFPEEYQEGKEYWVVVPKHILGIDTDFSFVAKKMDEYRRFDPLERQRELSRWDKMQRWERNMYEDRIAILMQQRLLLEGGNGSMGTVNGGGVLTSRVVSAGAAMPVSNNKRCRDFPMAVKPVAASTPDSLAGATTQTITNYSEVPDSKRRCIRMKPPIPSRYQG